MYKENRLLEVCFQPVFYFFLLFTLGIFIENFLNFSISLLTISLMINLTLALICYFVKYFNKPLSFLLMLGFLLVGALLGQIEREKISNSMELIDREVYVDFNSNQKIEIYGEVLSYPKITPSGINVDIKTNFINKTGRVIKLNAQVKLNIWLNKDAEFKKVNDLVPNTNIYVLAELLSQQKFKNPGLIDNRQILIQQGYDFAISLQDLSYLEILYKREPSNLSIMVYRINRYFINRIEQNFTFDKAAVLKAIILGDDSYLDLNLAEKFRISGLYHILVISGSHIAFLTWVLYKLVSVITRSNWIKFLIISLFIWTYALVTGGEPPIMRAILMATVILIGALWYKEIRPSNNIGVSGLILLAYHPRALFETSFQLTFLAIFLILLLIIPLVEKLAKIGKWYPTSQSPYPPECLPFIKWLAELLFWSEKQFIKRQKESHIKYKLEKNTWAIVLEKYKLQALLRIFSAMFITSFIVQLGMLPLSVIYFHRVIFISIILNIVSEILMNLLLINIFIFFIIDFCSSFLGYYMTYIIDYLLILFINTAWPTIFELINKKVSLFSYRVASVSNWQILFYVLYFVLILVVIIKINKWEFFLKPTKLDIADKSRQKQYIFNKYLAIFISICLVIIVLPQRFYQSVFYDKTNKLEVVFLDVGQGDAIFIEFPKGTKMMIDSGGYNYFNKEDKVKSKFSIGEQVDSMYLWSRGIEHLDYIVLTHPHNDHMEGFTRVVENFSIGKAIIPQGLMALKESNEWKDFLSLLTSNNIPINVWSRGQSYFIDGVKLDILWSGNTVESNAINMTNKRVNNESLVLRLSYQGYSILLTGDIEKEVEDILVNSNEDLLAEVIKSPHHGSRTSSSKNFLERVNPAVSIISAPMKSRFNHPHLEVIERYKNLGTTIYQTGLSGAITVYIKDNELHVREFARSKIVAN